MPHKVEFICWPFGNRKDRRELFCMQCGRTARSVKQMAKLPCTPIFPREKGWGRRKKTIADFNGAIGTLSKDKEKTARKILDVLLSPMHNPNMIRQREFVPKHEGNTILTALDKDLYPICMMAMELLKDEGKDPAFFPLLNLNVMCTVCKKTSAQKHTLRTRTCVPLGPNGQGIDAGAWYHRVRLMTEMKKRDDEEAEMLCSLLEFPRDIFDSLGLEKKRGRDTNEQ